MLTYSRSSLPPLLSLSLIQQLGKCKQLLLLPGWFISLQFLTRCLCSLYWRTPRHAWRRFLQSGRWCLTSSIIWCLQALLSETMAAAKHKEERISIASPEQHLVVSPSSPQTSRPVKGRVLRYTWPADWPYSIALIDGLSRNLSLEHLSKMPCTWDKVLGCRQ